LVLHVLVSSVILTHDAESAATADCSAPDTAGYRQR
jgi:hypothetical protein